MRKRFLSVLLTLCMVLTLLPLASFAADEENSTAPTVAGYGFVWNADKYKKDAANGTTLTGGFYAGDDWMGETAYVVVGDSTAANINLWFELTVGADTWGCAATTSDTANMFAFSFLNRGTQWEQHPTIEGETFDYSGANVTHATKYLADKNVDSITLKVYQTNELFSESSHNTAGLTPFFIREIAVTEGTDTMKTVPDTIAEVELELDTSGIDADTAVDDLPPATVKSVKLTDEGTAITTGTDTYVSVETKWYKEDGTTELTTNDTLTAGDTIKYTITVTAKSSSEAAYALAANAVKVTNVTDATVTDNVASGTFTVPAAAEKYTIKFAPGEGASGSMTEEKVAKAGSGATTYTTPTTHTFTAPTDKTFDKWTVNEITGVTISEDGKTLTIGENVAVSEVITLTATWKTTAVAPAAEPEFTLVPGSFEFVGKQVSDLQSGVSIAKDANAANTWVITTSEEGKISYISGWTGFNTALTSEQNGYYIAYSVPKTIGTSGNEQTITGMILTGHDANGDPVEKKYEDAAALNGVFTDNGNTACYIISHIGSDDSAKNASLTIKLKYGSAAEYTQYTIKCSNVNLEEKATIVEIEGTTGGTAEAPTLSVTASQAALADAINAAKTENNSVSDNAEKTPVTIKVGVPSSTDEADVAGGTVTIPADVLSSLKTDGASAPDMPLAVDVPNVGSITLPVESVEKLATENKEITVEVATNPDAAAPSDTVLAAAGITNAENYESSAFKAEVKVDGTVVGSTDTAWGTDSGAFITLVFNIGANPNWTTNDIKVIHRSGSSEEVIKLDDMSYDATTGLLTVKVKHLSDTIIYTPKATSSSSITITCTRDNNFIGPKVTVTGLTAAKVTIQIAGANNGAPAVIFNMNTVAEPAGGTKVEFNATEGSVVTVWDGQLTFDSNGVPNNSPALEYAQKTVTNP